MDFRPTIVIVEHGKGPVNVIRTFEMRLDLRGSDNARLDPVLYGYASVMARAERLLLSRLKAGRVWTGDLKVSVYQPLGLSAVHLDMAYRQLMAQLSSVAELAKDRVKDLAQKIGSKRTDIARKRNRLIRSISGLAKLRQETASLETRIGKRRLALAAASDMTRADQLFVLKHLLGQYYAKVAAEVSFREQIANLRLGRHQHQRRLAILEFKLSDAREQAKNPSLFFGSGKLFRAQFELEANGYEDLSAWRDEWRNSKSSQFTLDGNSSKEGGNQFARPHRRAACSAAVVGTQVPTRKEDVCDVGRETVGPWSGQPLPWPHGGGGTFPPEAALVIRPRGGPDAENSSLN